MNIERIKQLGKCCATEEPLHTSDNLTWVQLAFKAQWDFPVHGNVLTGQSRMALAVVHDCAIANDNDLMSEIKYAIELRDDEIIYHPLSELQPVVIKTYVIAGIGHEQSITCLRCNKTSYNSNDVKNKYCNYCKIFHEG